MKNEGWMVEYEKEHKIVECEKTSLPKHSNLQKPLEIVSKDH